MGMESGAGTAGEDDAFHGGERRKRGYVLYGNAVAEPELRGGHFAWTGHQLIGHSSCEHSMRK